VLNRFKNRSLNVLVATDIVSRGIDVENIDMVVNYDVPHDAEDYIHRIGRTARAEASGIAITFISPKEQHKFAAIERLLGKPVHKGEIPVQFGPAPEYRAIKR
jgi:superfamily II DNA/RNA helicase